MDAVVKVYCVHTEPNYSLPWQRKRQYGSTSSGFMVQGPQGERWLLTNAHAVEYYSQVRVVTFNSFISSWRSHLHMSGQVAWLHVRLLPGMVRALCCGRALREFCTMR